jgi:DNA processing protein
MDDQTLYQLALTRLPGIGDVYTKKLIEHFGDARAVFHADASALHQTGIPQKQVDAILQFSAWNELRNELVMLSHEGIRTLFFTDSGYPRRLKEVSDKPPLLFYRGPADLDAERVIAIVGTRTPTDYGRQMTQRLIRQLAQPGLLIISGLAFGIDAAAHKAAMANNIPTVGILGTGLGQCYPREHTGLAKDMRQQGGLLSAFPHNNGPETFSFPLRNRLIAALCDALIVVESGTTGGSLLTVDDAKKYGKKIFAVPGRVTDPKSAGCLRLIREGSAKLLLSGEQLQADMTWQWPAGRTGLQPDLPFPATPANRPEPENQLVELLREKDSLSVDELAAFSRLDAPSIAITLLNLELQGLICPLPGKRYRLNR